MSWLSLCTRPVQCLVHWGCTLVRGDVALGLCPGLHVQSLGLVSGTAINKQTHEQNGLWSLESSWFNTAWSNKWPWPLSPASVAVQFQNMTD